MSPGSLSSTIFRPQLDIDVGVQVSIRISRFQAVASTPGWRPGSSSLVRGSSATMSASAFTWGCHARQSGRSLPAMSSCTLHVWRGGLGWWVQCVPMWCGTDLLDMLWVLAGVGQQGMWGLGWLGRQARRRVGAEDTNLACDWAGGMRGGASTALGECPGRASRGPRICREAGRLGLGAGVGATALGPAWVIGIRGGAPAALVEVPGRASSGPRTCWAGNLGEGTWCGAVYHPTGTKGRASVSYLLHR